MKYLTIYWILLAFALCGCSVATRTPEKFSVQLSSADRLVITNRYYAFGVTTAGTDVSSLVTAIKTSKTKKWGAGMDWDSPFVCNLEFYTGTNLLADIPTVYGVFNLEGVEYYDGSGVLQAFSKKVAGYRTR